MVSRIPCVPLSPLWLNSIRENSHRHPSHDGIRSWHLHPERGPHAGAPGPRKQVLSHRIAGEGGGMWSTAAEFPRGGADRTRRHAEGESRFPDDRTAPGVRRGSHSAPVLDSARAELPLYSDRARSVGAYVWIAQRFQFAPQPALLPDAARVAEGGARDRGIAIHQERN